MITAIGATKRFGALTAVDHVCAEIKDGSVFGLIGSNGAGKSTFLRMLAGILQPDEGRVAIDGDEVFENVALKQRCFFISDEQFFFPNCTPAEMKDFYKRYYTQFDEPRYHKLMAGFSLDENRKIRTFSKGMKKQVSVICGVCAGTDYLFCDETFDGLDPVVRQTVKSLFAEDVAERGMTPVIASHNLRELEDICDHVGLLHRGGILFSRDLDEMKLGMFKMQCIFPGQLEADAWSGFDILRLEQRGSLYTLTARGSREELQNRVAEMNPTFFELLPLTLEEIFINETEVAGYDIKKLLV
ncbi:ABC transporter ATP-binding protein [Agathobaculum sp.]|uniref:ABC transporter ATP-binding protein n=1 Tax=Agathobaculum sp. TaxID=2048138 RepID=UPI002A8333C9|nr:ABC transporter ATP-binding protein [Agathobaculum sp.]MDY3617439.1 ABC transporter ATP-binding protein [Agathobaculum sp.]